MKVSNDKYRLPEAVAESSAELAKICGVTRSAVDTAICNAKRRKQNSIYVKIVIEDEEEGVE